MHAQKITKTDIKIQFFEFIRFLGYKKTNIASI